MPASFHFYWLWALVLKSSEHGESSQPLQDLQEVPQSPTAVLKTTAPMKKQKHLLAPTEGLCMCLVFAQGE
jgi:hypothetical protein